jgi:hypothetical protein
VIKNKTSLLLLAVLSVTDAYLLSHANLIGKIGIFLYKHSYIKSFSRALVTVGVTVIMAIVLCELLYRNLKPIKALLCLVALELASIGLFMYVYKTFSSFAYSLTGKAFIYGAHLLPVILIGIFARYLTVRFLSTQKNPTNNLN